MKKTTSNLESNLEKWMASPAFDEFVGRRVRFKLAVLAAVISGDESLASVARRYGTTRQAASKHAANARRIFGISNP
jgi:hypothetical protein